MHAMPLGELLASLAAKSPTPGGGAAAAHAGAIAVALAEMVVAYSVGRKSLAAHEPLLLDAAAVLARARAALLRLAEEDAAAYGAVNELQRLPESDPRRAALPRAVRAAVAVPMAAATTCAEALGIMVTLRGRSNPHLASDLRIAELLAHAGVRASACNVEVNLPSLADATEADAARAQVQALLARADSTAATAPQPAGGSSAV